MTDYAETLLALQAAHKSCEDLARQQKWALAADAAADCVQLSTKLMVWMERQTYSARGDR